jgi:hypothetical protein
MGSAALFDLFALKTKENRADQAVPLFPRARRAISCDSSVRRSAQDDGFVGIVKGVTDTRCSTRREGVVEKMYVCLGLRC